MLVLKDEPRSAASLQQWRMLLFYQCAYCSEWHSLFCWVTGQYEYLHLRTVRSSRGILFCLWKGGKKEEGGGGVTSWPEVTAKDLVNQRRGLGLPVKPADTYKNHQNSYHQKLTFSHFEEKKKKRLTSGSRWDRLSAWHQWCIAKTHGRPLGFQSENVSQFLCKAEVGQCEHAVLPALRKSKPLRQLQWLLSQPPHPRSKRREESFIFYQESNDHGFKVN